MVNNFGNSIECIRSQCSVPPSTVQFDDEQSHNTPKSPIDNTTTRIKYTKFNVYIQLVNCSIKEGEHCILMLIQLCKCIGIRKLGESQMQADI